MIEQWKVVDGFASYSISNFGRVVSRRLKHEKVLTGTVHPGGYILHQLVDDTGIKRVRLAHRLVAFAFIGPPPPGCTDVCHNNGVPNDNHVGNLRWDTHFGNQMDMRRHGTMQDGEKSITHKLTTDEILKIRDTVKSGPRGTARRLAHHYGISVAHMSRIVNGHRWAALLEETTS